MKDDRNIPKSPEQLAKEEAYREYLKMREGKTSPSVTETPYGASELRKRSKEEQQRRAYLDARVESSQEAAEEERRAMQHARRTARSDRKRRRKKSSRGLRVALIIVLVFVLGIAGTAAAGIGIAASTMGKIGKLDIDRGKIGISSKAAGNLSDYTNIAVLGVDSRDMEDDSESRSDAIVIVSINNETNELKMFSVFRDTLLDLGEDVGLDKITHAYFYGGAQKSLYALNKNLDLNIERAVVINWKTVAEVIDSLGGIKVDIQESEIEEMNKYIPGTAKRTGSKKKLIKEPGKQKLNGAQAVTYARIRKDAITGDYRRNERMKIVMKKTFQKAKKADLLTLKKICDNALPQAKTNIPTSEMLQMAMKLKKYDMTSSTTGWPYDVASWTGYAGGGYAWYGPPQTLYSNVVQLYDKFFGISDYEPTEDVRSISENISYTTGLY